MDRKTAVAIDGQSFLLNDRPTYEGVTFRGMKVEGLLMNARMVQGAFDDLNAETRTRWNYPDGPWDPERNTREFIAAMPSWRAHGLAAFTVNLQGGSPMGYSREQPWHNSTFRPDGSMRPEYLGRTRRIIDRADELGMVVILGYFYFGQDHRLDDEAAVLRAADAATDWVLDNRWTNVIIEVGNEVDHRAYTHAIIRAPRCHELIDRVQTRSRGKVNAPAGRLLVSTSTCGGVVPPANLVEAADFILLHGNGVDDPAGIRTMVDETRASAAYRGRPVLFNEDDHFAFGAPDNNMLAALGRYAGWGFFDWRQPGEDFHQGYQSVPVDWTIGSERKKGFFGLLKQMTGR